MAESSFTHLNPHLDHQSTKKMHFPKRSLSIIALFSTILAETANAKPAGCYVVTK
jgi:hypothetical protein